MLFLSSDAFDNPDSPEYYVVGVIFLALIFGLLAAYLLLSKYFEKKRKDKAGENAEDNTTGGETVSQDAVTSEESKDSAVSKDRDE